MTARLRDLLDAVELGGKPLPDGRQVADLLAEVIVKNALKGDHRFVATVLDRTEATQAGSTDDQIKPRIVIPGSEAEGPGGPPAPRGAGRRKPPA